MYCVSKCGQHSFLLMFVMICWSRKTHPNPHVYLCTLWCGFLREKMNKNIFNLRIPFVFHWCLKCFKPWRQNVTLKLNTFNTSLYGCMFIDKHGNYNTEIQNSCCLYCIKSETNNTHFKFYDNFYAVVVYLYLFHRDLCNNDSDIFGKKQFIYPSLLI